MPDEILLEIRDNSGNLVGVSELVSARWSLQLLGGCGPASFTLARDWDEVSDLTDTGQLRVKVNGETYWDGIIQSLSIGQDAYPVIEAVGHRERLKRLGWFARQWTTIDKGTSQVAPTLDLDDDVGAAILARMTGLFTDLTSSRSLASQLTSHCSLEGSGYDILDRLVQLYAGQAVWGVDEGKVLYLKDAPTALASNMYFPHGKDTALQFTRDSSQIVNNILVQGIDQDTGLPELTGQYMAYFQRQLWWYAGGKGSGARPKWEPKYNPAWNLLPNASFEQRRSDIYTRLTQNPASDDLLVLYSWPGLKVTLEQPVISTYTPVVGGRYDDSAWPGRAGESNIKATLTSSADGVSDLKVETAFGAGTDPDANEDARIPIVPQMTLRFCAAVYCESIGANPVILAWYITTYDSTDTIVQNNVLIGSATLVDGWNTWDDGLGSLQGTDTSKQITLGGGAAVRAKVLMMITLNTASAVSQLIYVDAWQCQTGGTSQPFSPAQVYWQQYKSDGSYMTSEASEIRNSSSNYGTRQQRVNASIRDVFYNATSDGVQFAKSFFWNNAVPFCTGRLDYLGEAKLFRPWDGLMRLIGLPDAVADKLRRFSTDTFVDLQVNEVQYSWNGHDLSIALAWSNTRRYISFNERAEPLPPPITKEGWRDTVGRVRGMT